METVQELGRQGIPFQGDEGNDYFSRILLLRGKDDPEAAKRVLNNTDPKLKKYTHDQYQNELIEACATFKAQRNSSKHVFWFNGW